MGRFRERSQACWASTDRHPAAHRAVGHPAAHWAVGRPAAHWAYTELIAWAADQVRKVGASEDSAALKTTTRRCQCRSMRCNPLWPAEPDRRVSFHLPLMYWANKAQRQLGNGIRFSDGKGHLSPDHPSAERLRAGMSAKQRALQACMHGSSDVCRAAAIPPRGSRGHR